MSLDPNVLVAALNAARQYWGDYAEIFAEHRADTMILLDDGRLDRVSAGEEAGAGIRVFQGQTAAYVYTTDLSQASLVEALRLASIAAKQRATSGETMIAALDRHTPPRPLAHYRAMPDTIPLADKVAVVRRADRVARAVGSEIRQVTSIYQDYIQDVTIVNSLEEAAQDRRVRTMFGLMVVAADGDIIQTAFESTGGLAGFEQVAGDVPESLGRMAAERALLMLRARPAPAGTMPVVCAAEAGGVLIHEAMGHGLEADNNLPTKHKSVFAGKIGQSVANSKVTIVDDATLAGQYGSMGCDDEGVPAQRRVLIDHGILKSYMHDRTTAREMGLAPNGSGRRESFRHTPMPRMSNTFMLAGEDSPEDIIRSVQHGLLVKRMGGGEVNIVSGEFVFKVEAGYLIENGAITEPVRGATLIGHGPAVLRIIDMVGNDIGPMRAGGCGKYNQTAPVSSAIPTVRIPELVVGGIVPGMRETVR